MKETNQEVIDKLKEELAQEINSIEEINNNPVITEEDNNPEPIEEIKEEEITPTPEPIITEEQIKPKNTVRIMNGNFPF